MKIPNPPPIPHPSMNPGWYANSGRDCYEVEEEMLALLLSIVPLSRWRRRFSLAQWRLWYLQHKFYPQTGRRVLKDRIEYYAQ